MKHSRLGSLRLSKGPLIILLLLTSCTKKPQAEVTPAPVEAESSAPVAITPKVDYDLSNMNFTMISGFFFEMLIDPETYENKTFKIKGKFQSFDNEEDPTALPYFSVIMNDVTMCCHVFIKTRFNPVLHEFYLNPKKEGGHKYSHVIDEETGLCH